MITSETIYKNSSDSVNFILHGARKRRNTAIASAKNLNSDAGILTNTKIISIAGT